MSIEIRREGAISFTIPLPRALFRDVRLSFGARGLFAFLWDLPNGWRYNLAHLATMGPEGRDALRARLRELQVVGAVRIEAIREDSDGNPIPCGRVSGKRWVLIAAERWAVEAPLGITRDSHTDKDFSEDGKTRFSVKPIIGKADAKVLQGGKVLQNEAAAGAQARLPADAAIPQGKQDPGRRRRGDEIVRHGVEIWTPADADGLQVLIDRHGAARVEEVAKSLISATGHRAPYLSAVTAAFQALDKAAAASAAREAARQAAIVRDATVLPREEQRARAAELRAILASRKSSSHQLDQEAHG